jgi:hypothetical protein
MHSWWPWNSLRKAHSTWQALESRRLAAQQRLERLYLILWREAESVPLEPDQGLLREAQGALDRSHDPLTLEAHNRLRKAFAILGKSFLRRTPPDLQKELRRYAVRINAVCRGYEEMSLRLQFAQKIISLFRQNPEAGGVPACRLALISPEAALLVDHLRLRRLEEHQSRQHCLAQGWTLRMANCRRWLALLKNSLPPKTHRQFERSLMDLAERAVGAAKPEVSELTMEHDKLDLLTIIANRQATRTIADLLSETSN